MCGRFLAVLPFLNLFDLFDLFVFASNPLVGVAAGYHSIISILLAWNPLEAFLMKPRSAIRSLPKLLRSNR